MTANFTLSVSADTRGAYKLLNQINKDIEKMDRVEVLKVGQLAFQYARAIAPYRTGATMRAITMKGTNQYQTKLTAGDGHIGKKGGEPDKQWRGQHFNLTYWMHHSAKALSHIRSGNPRFMIATALYIEKRFYIDTKESTDKLVMKWKSY